MRGNIFLATLVCFTAATVSAEQVENVELLASSCAACHGTSGQSVGGNPSLAGLDKSYFLIQMREFVSGARSSTVMQQQATGLSSEQIELLADYFSSLN